MKLLARLGKQILKLHSGRVCLHSSARLSSLSHNVIVSRSKNIHENLALEDWLFENTDLENQSLLLLWRDEPCVVFGRHQNPWVECNVPYCEKHNIRLARRKSGGGTVYHDEGNINCSFITSRSAYNREANLRLIVQALTDTWSLPLTINCRDDILLHDKFKISGTAAKLTRHKGYHHFTLLLNVDKIRLKSILCSNLEGVKSNATKSVRMSVANLADHIPELEYEALEHVITEKYCRHNQDATVSHVDPVDETLFPGVCKHLEELTSSQWLFSKTPAFSIERTFRSDPSVLDSSNSSPHTAVHISLDVTKGRMHNARVELELLPGIATGAMDKTSVLDPAVLDIRAGLEETLYDMSSVSETLANIKLGWIARRLYDVNTHVILDWLLSCVIETTGLFHVSANPKSL